MRKKQEEMKMLVEIILIKKHSKITEIVKRYFKVIKHKINA